MPRWRPFYFKFKLLLGTLDAYLKLNVSWLGCPKEPRWHDSIYMIIDKANAIIVSTDYDCV